MAKIIKKKQIENNSCPSMVVCIQFARRFYHPDLSDILNLCEGCYNPLDNKELKNVCRGKNYG